MGKTVTAVARELSERLDAQHAIRVGELLGCEVTILRREQRKTAAGRYSGISEPVFGVPAEFVEAAQALGLLAEAR